MSAFSILYEAPDDGVREHDPTEPVFFSDLHLDQVVDAAITGFQEYDIRPFFYDPLTSVDAVMYRQEVVRDLGDTGVFEAVSSFSQGMQSMRQQLSQAQKLHYRYEKERWFLDAVTTYCETVQRLVRNLADLDLRSRGFLNLFDYLDHFAQSPDFTSLVAEVNRLRTELSGVTYGRISGGTRSPFSKANSTTSMSGRWNGPSRGSFKNRSGPFSRSHRSTPG